MSLTFVRKSENSIVLEFHFRPLPGKPVSSASVQGEAFGKPLILPRPGVGKVKFLCKIKRL